MSGRTSGAGLSWRTFKKEWGGWYAEKSPVLLFGVKFALLIALLYVLLALPVGDRLLYRDLEANAWVAEGILRALGQQTHLSQGVVIESSRFSMGIRRGCDAIEATWLLCAAMLVFPAPWGRKIAGIAVAFVSLQLLNLVRILTLYWVGVHWPAFFDSVHLEIWPVIFILVIIVFFLRWKGGLPDPDRPAVA